MKGMVYANIDVAMIRDPKVLAAGYTARMMYVQIMLYCRENLTDGYLDEMLVRSVAADIPRPRVCLAKLCEVNLLERVENGWRIPIEVWRKWNPLRSEVEAKRQAEAIRKAGYRSTVRDVSAGTDSPQNISRGQEEEEAKEEAKSSSSRVTQTGADPFPTATTLEQRVVDAIDHHARTSSEGKDKPGAYAARVRANTLVEHGAALTEYAGQHPDATPARIIEAVFGQNTGWREPVKEAWYADPHCGTCGGDGFQNHAPEGAPSMLGSCHCRSDNPYLAEVVQLRQVAL